MATKITSFNLSSSPPSGGSRTHHGTPSTVATIMSPDTSNEAFEGNSHVPEIKLESSTSTNLAGRRKLHIAPLNVESSLSATAEDFTPSATTSTFPTAPNPGGYVAPARTASLAVRDLLSGSSPDSSPSSNSSEIILTTCEQRHPGVIGTLPSTRNNTSTQQQAPIHLSTFTIDDNVTRAFGITGIKHLVNPLFARYVANSYKHFSSLAAIDLSRIYDGYYTVQFYDVDDAKQALYLTLRTIFRGTEARPFQLTPKLLAYYQGKLANTVSEYQGEYIVTVHNFGPVTAHLTAEDVLQACAEYGKIKAFETTRPMGGALMAFRVEYKDTRAPATSLNMSLIKGYQICVVPNQPDIRGTLRQPMIADLHDDASGENSRKRQRDQDKLHNYVDIMKIVMGHDVRTTIMLRNIPNRVNQANLKQLLDETSFGQYDFMYLRIDFANNCNVGYAFINFTDPMYILPFAEARAGKKWNLFQSDKVAEISYATIQGRDCLIQKFRNSSVMLEHETFRPKLYIAGVGPDAGEEEKFPEPDNLAKLKRSCDNAEHVGLYIPDVPNGPGPFTIAPPVNQRAGGTYHKPAASRGAIVYNRLTANPSRNRLYPPSQGGRKNFSQYDRGTECVHACPTRTCPAPTVCGAGGGLGTTTLRLDDCYAKFTQGFRNFGI